ncbi:MAG: hypothetical protein HY912_14655 [Desulfomonile tiedjei]|uniref:Secreted protein n=1 Tax=Desulfomonile tiedjei TaxID=2358 RepID=A0A9D6V4T3_9BACT|nr:hypothetical protein [Desulfomonile tiedjei]
MRRLSGILTVCLALALALHLAYSGTADSKSPYDSISNGVSRTFSQTYGVIESLILPGSIKTASLESQDEEKNESDEEVSANKEEQPEEPKEEGPDRESFLWKPTA